MDKFLLRKEYFIDSVKGDITSCYKFDRKLGDGSFGIVYLATHRPTGQKRAIKQIPKYKIRNHARMQSEINIMKKADHPHIVKLYELWEDRTNLYLVLELCEGGELFDHIVSKKRLSEREAAGLFRQLLLSLRYLHSHHIAHRDLKPENLLLNTHRADAKLKLCDFGLSRMCLQDKELMKTKAGTPLYVSPEILSGRGYTTSCDIWSAGVILYIILCGYPPFYGSTDCLTLQKVRGGVYNFDKPEWQNVSDLAKDLIQHLLVLNPSERYTVDQALEHPWISSYTQLPERPLSVNIEALRDFRNGYKLRKAVLMQIASQCIDSDIENLREIFLKLDVNGDGVLTLAELQEGLSNMPGVNSEEIEELMNSMDVDKNGTIDYTEFLAASLDKSIYLQEQRLVEAFRIFDKDGSGKISADELRDVLGSNTDANATLWGEMIREADENGDGEIDYNEFMHLMHTKRVESR
jgi:calcium-dependent protein kinase